MVAVVFAFKLLQFVDRGVQSGAPSAFGAFIERTTHEVDDQALLFAAMASTYSLGTMVGCVGAVLLLSRNSGHGSGGATDGATEAGASLKPAVILRLARRYGVIANGSATGGGRDGGSGGERAPTSIAHGLLGRGMGTWLLGVTLSALAYWMPPDPSTFYAFCASRALVGLGAGCVTVTWPPYIEAIAAPRDRSMAMTLVEMGTALGAALGFLFSAFVSVRHLTTSRPLLPPFPSPWAVSRASLPIPTRASPPAHPHLPTPIHPPPALPSAAAART